MNSHPQAASVLGRYYRYQNRPVLNGVSLSGQAVYCWIATIRACYADHHRNGQPRLTMQTIEYSISPHNPAAHHFRMTCTLAQPQAQGQVFSLPAWIPGSYVIRDFAKQVLTISAECNGQPVGVEKLDKQTWQCEACDGPLQVTYDVYARDESVRAAFLDRRRGFFNGTSVFLSPDGCADLPCTLNIAPPPKSVEGDWSVVTTLPSVFVDHAGYGDYRAENYAQLIDHPVAMGQVDLVEFEVAGKYHGMALLGRHDADRKRLAADLTRVCSEHIHMFGEMPAPGYLFLAQIVGSGYGGLEHRDCSVLQVARNSLPVPGAPEEPRPEDYVNMLGLCSHEYFHLWNVKRIRPQAVAESDLRSEAHFRDLWAYEGVTSYYDELALVRAGLTPPENYLRKLARDASRLAQTPGRHKQSLADSSFDAWTKFYRPDENTPNAVVSYYGKGGLVALCLDLTLRLQSEGALNLDYMMQMAWQRYGHNETLVPDGGLQALCQEAAGPQLQAFFDRYVHATEDPPYAELLPQFGVVCEKVVPSSNAAGAAPEIAALGLRLATGTSELRLQYVLDASAAQAAGLSPQDVLVAINGLRVTHGNLTARLKRCRNGEKVELQFFRDDELLSTTLKISAPIADTWQFTLDTHASDAALHRRKAWLAPRGVAAKA